MAYHEKRYRQGLGSPESVLPMAFDLSVDLLCNRPGWGFSFTYYFNKVSVLKVYLKGNIRFKVQNSVLRLS